MLSTLELFNLVATKIEHDINNARRRQRPPHLSYLSGEAGS